MKLLIEQKNFLATKKLSYSSLKAFGRSPRHYVQYCLFPKDSTPAMIIGSAFDCLLLTPDDFKSKFMVMPEFKKKELKTDPTIVEQKQKFMDQNPGVTILKQSDIDTVRKMRDELMENEITSVYVKMKGEVQKHVYWSDKHTGLKFHGFIDKFCPELTLEVKKVADGSKDVFMRDALKFGYPLQAACYQLATKRLFDKEFPFMYLVMEATEPFNPNVFKATEEFMSLGYNQFKMLCKEFVRCVEGDLWHEGYEFYQGLGYENLNLPPWAKI